IRAVVVDDEPPARDRIRWLLQDQADVELVGEYEDGRCAVAALRQRPADLLFLDVRLPGADGVSVLESLGDEAPPQVIFVTAYGDYALRAFDFAATDYLLKPYDADRFYEALERARRALRPSAPEHNAPARTPPGRSGAPGAAQAGTSGGYLQRLAVRSGGRIVLLRMDDVEWIEARGNYARLHLAPSPGVVAPGAGGGREPRGPVHLVRETMAALEAALDPERFARIHRSTIVNLERVRELHPLFHGEYVVLMRSGERLTLSRGYRERLRGRWGRAL
ncbi:MAG TPA: LytTR family DNA-binding domain-containing protein, partial [Longimicrobiales bacterium]